MMSTESTKPLYEDQKLKNISIHNTQIENQLPVSFDLSSTPGGTFFSTTPGGTRIVYDRTFLLKCRNSPLANSPPVNLPKIPGVTCPPIPPPSKNKKETVEVVDESGGNDLKQVIENGSNENCETAGQQEMDNNNSNGGNKNAKKNKNKKNSSSKKAAASKSENGSGNENDKQNNRNHWSPNGQVIVQQQNDRNGGKPYNWHSYQGSGVPKSRNYSESSTGRVNKSYFYGNPNHTNYYMNSNKNNGIYTASYYPIEMPYDPSNYQYNPLENGFSNLAKSLPNKGGFIRRKYYYKGNPDRKSSLGFINNAPRNFNNFSNDYLETNGTSNVSSVSNNLDIILKSNLSPTAFEFVPRSFKVETKKEEEEAKIALKGDVEKCSSLVDESDQKFVDISGIKKDLENKDNLEDTHQFQVDL